MSRTAAATPPPPFFPARNLTPSMRHSSGPQQPAHYPHAFQKHFSRRRSKASTPKKGTSPSATLPDLNHNNISSPGQEFSEILPLGGFAPIHDDGTRTNEEDQQQAHADSIHTGSVTPSSRPSRSASVCSNADSFQTTRTSSSQVDNDSSSFRTSAPSMKTDLSSSASLGQLVITPRSTPAASITEVSLEGEVDTVAISVDVTPTNENQLPVFVPSPTRPSWVGGFGLGKMAKAVGTGVIGLTFGKRREGVESPKVASPAPAFPTTTAAITFPPVSAITPKPSPPVISQSPEFGVWDLPCLPPAPQVMYVQPEQVQLPAHVVPPPIASVLNAPPLPGEAPARDLFHMSPAERARRNRWAEDLKQRVFECARLCSQWPQSGYNLAKYGPNGCPHYYQPQSWANPQHVVNTMQRQAELETRIWNSSAMFFACRDQRKNSLSMFSRSPSPSAESDRSGLDVDSVSISTSTTTSPAASLDASAMVTAAEKKTAEDVRAAMASPLIEHHSLSASTRSLSELDRLASMVLEKDDRMDIDKSSSSEQAISESTGNIDRSSCGAKRQRGLIVPTDEDKRRKVVEQSVLASVTAITSSTTLSVETSSTSTTTTSTSTTITTTFDSEVRSSMGVCAAQMINENGQPMINPAVIDPSTGRALSNNPACLVAGTTAMVPSPVVKTSETHPIVISPFIPAEALPLLAKHLVQPPRAQSSTCPLALDSEIDVPTLLLSYPPPSPTCTGSTISCSTDSVLPTGIHTPRLVPSPGRLSSSSSSFSSASSASLSSASSPVEQPLVLGNVLLSSCPGKRLRMNGPVKGRGPVCRDLKTDLIRIKGEGVGCLVCCLDDAELSLLGVPWETYRQTADELGLDVIRLPMPDGFTPVSLQLFDTQVELMVKQYTLKGVNVLVHCRGGIGRAGLTACAWAIKMGFVQPHPSLILMSQSRAAASGATASESSAFPLSLSNNPSSKSTSRAPSLMSRRSFCTSSAAFTHSGKHERTISPRSSSPTKVDDNRIVSSTSTSATNLVTKAAQRGRDAEHDINMSIVERAVAMIRSRRGLKAIESYEQVKFLYHYVKWLRAGGNIEIEKEW